MKCTPCNGHGRRRDENLKIEDCKKCGGTGQVPDGTYLDKPKGKVGRSVRYTSDVVDEMVRMKADGLSVYEIADLLRMPTSSAYYILGNLNKD